MKLTYKLFGLLVIVFLLSSCAGSPLQTQAEAQQNRSNMIHLKIGMSKEQVYELMGNPYRTESYKVEGKILEFWLYLTEGKAVYGSLGYSDFTPLAFEENILIGWGAKYYDKQ